jgi:hypothetical protein
MGQMLQARNLPPQFAESQRSQRIMGMEFAEFEPCDAVVFLDCICLSSLNGFNAHF